MSSSYIHVKLFYQVLSSIFKAVSKEMGIDSWSVLWRTGRILFKKINVDLGITPDMDLERAFAKLANYLKVAHVIREVYFDIDMEEGVIEYRLELPFPLKYERREEVGPIYLFSSLFSAVMEYIGVRVERESEPIIEGNTLTERWRIVKR